MEGGRGVDGVWMGCGWGVDGVWMGHVRGRYGAWTGRGWVSMGVDGRR